VQVPPSGLPIVLGPDGGTTGGYPVVGVIPQSGLDALAQRRPGERVRFNIREQRQETSL
jgi:allophanate hydrolase subunit 2